MPTIVGGIVRLREYSIWLISPAYLHADMIRGPLRLRDHVATLSAYLDDYINPNNSMNQKEYSSKFTNYLISTCWRKMVRRIQSWQAMGFMYLANCISTEQLRVFGSHWNGFCTDDHGGPGDRTLMSFLSTLKDNLKRKLLLASHRTKPPLNYTEADFPLMFKVESAAIIFSKDTVVEFHKLTMAAFDGFAFSFMQLKKASNDLVSGID
jgi:hypothetical protein